MQRQEENLRPTGRSGLARLRYGGAWVVALTLITLSAFALEIGPELIARIKGEQGAAVAARIEGW